MSCTPFMDGYEAWSQVQNTDQAALICPYNEETIEYDCWWSGYWERDDENFNSLVEEGLIDDEEWTCEG